MFWADQYLVSNLLDVSEISLKFFTVMFQNKCSVSMKSQKGQKSNRFFTKFKFYCYDTQIFLIEKDQTFIF